MEPRVAVLEQELTERRERYNGVFTLARRARPKLDGEEFSHNLRSLLGPIIAGVPQAQARAVVEPLYDLCLQLTAGDHFRRSQALRTVWSRLLPQAGVELAESPATLAASLSNAATNLEGQEGVDLEGWFALMERTRLPCSGSKMWLSVGQVAAWLCGMAHFREQAISIGEGLSPELRNALHPHWTEVVADPWYGQRPLDGRPKVVRRVGRFVGFGGCFHQPPWVAYCGQGRFLVEDGTESWVLSSDAFGSTLRPGTAEILEDARWDVAVNDHLEVRWGETTCSFPDITRVRSQAASEDLLVVSLEESHRLVVVLGPPR